MAMVMRMLLTAVNDGTGPAINGNSGGTSGNAGGLGTGTNNGTGNNGGSGNSVEQGTMADQAIPVEVAKNQHQHGRHQIRKIKNMEQITIIRKVWESFQPGSDVTVTSIEVTKDR